MPNLQCSILLTKPANGKENEEMKNIKLLILIVCFILTIAGSSCGNNQFNSATEQTPTSSLTSMLLETSDLSGNWKWTLSNIMQGPVKPSLDNNLSTEMASSALAGHLFIDEKKYTFTIYHSVQNYDQSTQYVPPPFSEAGDSEPFPIHLLKFGNEMKFQCLNYDSSADDPVLICQIAVKYKNVISFLNITGEINAGEPLIEEVINQILTAIDTHVKANQ